MTHETAREKLLDLAYGELTGREARRVEAHLHECEACRAELAAIRETRGLMSALGEAPAPERGEAELLAAARAAAEGRRRPRLLALPPWFLGASASAVALFVVGAISYRLLALGPARRADQEALLGRGPDAAVAVEPGAEATAQRDAAAAVERPTGEAAKSEPGTAAERGRAVVTEREPTVRAERVVPGLTEERRRKAFSERGPEESEDRAAELPAPPPIARTPAPRAEAPPPEPDRAPAPRGPSEDRARSAPEPRFAKAPAQEPSRADEPPPPPSSAPAYPAPAAGAAEAPGSARSGAPSAALAQRAPGESDPVARWQALRAAGRLRGEVVTFLECPGEAWRKVESDPQGRVIRYVRHGLAGGVPFEAELFYAEDGALGAARYREASGAWRELRFPGGWAAPADHIPPPALEPARAGDAAADAPPRCRF